MSADDAKIMSNVEQTLVFAFKVYDSKWEAVVGLLAAARILAIKSGLNWPELMAEVEKLVNELPPRFSPS